ncbi:GNAT family N-acetyltransferase [Candidatus Enterococcus ikei]|nr:GNAT family N-acetyltransferase [Enterococcus sp. DIV0869a]
MRLKQVTKDETQIAMSMLKETAEWLKEVGSDQWSEILHGEDKHGLANAVEKGEVFFLYNSSNLLVGMAAAWKTPTIWDELLWEDYGIYQEACYVHRVLIRPIYKGEGYGKELLNALKVKFEGEVSELRLDCLASNYKLIQFYKENKFTNIGSSTDSNGIKFELFSYSL